MSLVSFFALNDSSMASSISTARPTDVRKEDLCTSTVGVLVFKSRSKIETANKT
jgi:hypothetical protein